MTAPLTDTVVLDLGQIYAGPYCTHLLRSLGATVIKIEPPGGEPIRWRSTGDTSGQAFQLLNGGKSSLRLDLKQAAGRDVLLDLVRRADVVVENFSPGALERLDLGWDVLHAANPSLVLASASAYGDHPAAEGLRGMDITVQAMSGVVSATGFADGPPVKAGAAVADFATGTHLAAAVLAALLARTRTGEGQHVTVAMQDAILPALTSNIAGLLESGPGFPERTGNRHGGLAVCPYNIYATADGWLAILCVRPRHWSALCELMARPDLAEEPAYRTPAGRVAAMELIDAAVEEWTATGTTQQIFRLVQDADIPAAPVRTLADVLNDPVLRDRGMLGVVGDGAGEHTVFGSPLRMTGATAPTTPAPELGQDSTAVLRDMLGLSEARIAELGELGVI